MSSEYYHWFSAKPAIDVPPGRSNGSWRTYPELPTTITWVSFFQDRSHFSVIYVSQLDFCWLYILDLSSSLWERRVAGHIDYSMLLTKSKSTYHHQPENAPSPTLMPKFNTWCICVLSVIWIPSLATIMSSTSFVPFPSSQISGAVMCPIISSPMSGNFSKCSYIVIGRWQCCHEQGIDTILTCGKSVSPHSPWI